MDLFEVVAVLNVRLTKLVAFISEGQDKEVPPAVLAEEEQVALGSVLPMLSAQNVFSTRVLAVAAPELPAFSQHLYAPVTGQNGLRPAALDHLILAYARAKEEFIRSGLQPADECARKRAELAVHSGAWFGWAKQPTKARPIQVAQHQPGKSAEINGIVEEYGLPSSTSDRCKRTPRRQCAERTPWGGMPGHTTDQTPCTTASTRTTAAKSTVG